MPIEPDVLVIDTNFTYVIPLANRCLVIDPADFRTVDRYLTQRELVPSLIINTHHHGDHTNGNLPLKKKYNCPILGGDTRLPGIDQRVSDNQLLSFPPVHLRFLHTPGHTRGGICIQLGQLLFTGDTLFTAGCGRVFEGTFGDMYHSLRRLARMDSGVRILGGHNYARENLQFARFLFPEDPAIRSFQKRVESAARKNNGYVISTLREELAINPFLRADSLDRFTRWRKRKDRY